MKIIWNHTSINSNLPQEPTDIFSLIKGCCENNRISQREVYHWLHGYAMKISYRYLQQQEVAEEMVSEAFIKFYKSIGQFDTNRQSDLESLLKAWFKRILINTCIDYLRKSQLKLVSYDATIETSQMAEKQESGLDKIAYQEIIAAICQLSPVYRTVFNLFVIEGFSHEEIADLLNISIGASKSNLSKARANLRKIILGKKEYQKYA